MAGPSTGWVAVCHSSRVWTSKVRTHRDLTSEVGYRSTPRTRPRSATASGALRWSRVPRRTAAAARRGRAVVHRHCTRGSPQVSIMSLRRQVSRRRSHVRLGRTRWSRRSWQRSRNQRSQTPPRPDPRVPPGAEGRRVARSAAVEGCNRTVPFQFLVPGIIGVARCPRHRGCHSRGVPPWRSHRRRAPPGTHPAAIGTTSTSEATA